MNSPHKLINTHTHACSEDDVIYDVPWHRLRADEPHRPPLVHQIVEILGSLQHRVHGVTRRGVRHMGHILLLSAVHPIIFL